MDKQKFLKYMIKNLKLKTKMIGGNKINIYIILSQKSNYDNYIVSIQGLSEIFMDFNLYHYSYNDINDYISKCCNRTIGLFNVM